MKDSRFAIKVAPRVNNTNLCALCASVVKKTNPHFSPGGEMITQRFGFTKDFLKERNNSAYFRLNKILCGFKDQVRARPSGEKCGLGVSSKLDGLFAALI